MIIDMTNAPIEQILRDLDGPITDEDRIAAADEIQRLRERLQKTLREWIWEFAKSLDVADFDAKPPIKSPADAESDVEIHDAR
ncbi:MAG TPA: hypothetical protein VJ654_02920 [Noviherbaspirillum sp.]|nr:hypothetical protein [Noviherbaspirillum sp.]